MKHTWELSRDNLFIADCFLTASLLKQLTNAWCFCLAGT